VGPDAPRVGITSFALAAGTPALATALSAEHGIGVRRRVCAHPFVRKLLGSPAATHRRRARPSQHWVTPSATSIAVSAVDHWPAAEPIGPYVTHGEMCRILTPATKDIAENWF